MMIPKYVILLACLSYFFNATVCAEDDVSRCLKESHRVPLLGGDHDSLYVPVEVNGRKLAASFSPAYYETVIGGWFADYDDTGEQVTRPVIDGETADMEVVSLQSLKIGNLEILSSRALAPVRRRKHPKVGMIAGLPLLGGLGRHIFPDQYSFLIDIPHAQLIILVWDSDRCGLPRHLFVKPPHEVSVDDMMMVSARLNGHSMSISLDPDYKLPLIARSDFRAAGLSDKNTPPGPQTISRAKHMVIGWQYSLPSFEMGGELIKNMTAVVAKRLSNSALGQSFFSNHVVLIDGSDGKVFFADSNNENHNPDLNQYFLEMRLPQSSVQY